MRNFCKFCKSRKIPKYRHADQSELSKVDEITDHELAIPAEIELAMQDFNEVQCDSIDEETYFYKIIFYI